MSSLGPSDSTPYFTRVLCNLLNQRNASNGSENGSACFKTILSNKKLNFQENDDDLDMLAGSSLQDSDGKFSSKLYFPYN